MKRFIQVNYIEGVKFFNMFTVLVLAVYFLYAAGFSIIKLENQSEPVTHAFGFLAINKHYFRTVAFSILPILFIIHLSKEFSTGYASKLLCNGYSRISYLRSKYILILQLCFLAVTLFLIQVVISYLVVRPVFQPSPLFFITQSVSIFCSACYMLLLASVCTIAFRNMRNSIALFFLLQLFELIVAELLKQSPVIQYLPVSPVSFFYEKQTLLPLHGMLPLLLYASVFLFLNHRLMQKAEL